MRENRTRQQQIYAHRHCGIECVVWNMGECFYCVHVVGILSTFLSIYLFECVSLRGHFRQWTFFVLFTAAVALVRYVLCCVVLWRTLCIRFSNSQLFNFHLVRASNYINIYREIYRVYHPNVYRFVNASNATNFRHPRGGEIRREHTSLIRISIYLSLMNFSFVKRRGFWRGRASELYQHNHIDDPAKETHTHTKRVRVNVLLHIAHVRHIRWKCFSKSQSYSYTYSYQYTERHKI